MGTNSKKEFQFLPLSLLSAIRLISNNGFVVQSHTEVVGDLQLPRCGEDCVCRCGGGSAR
ncbi:MAG: hypothetical protein QOF42_2469 [Gammaproteobacteria bacterium]|jgi:hypothetical protein|nr:hypothetical protein [Gammaproteobacteria bacterium]